MVNSKCKRRLGCTSPDYPYSRYAVQCAIIGERRLLCVTSREDYVRTDSADRQFTEKYITIGNLTQ